MLHSFIYSLTDDETVIRSQSCRRIRLREILLT